jgi:hypothetical protein
MTTDHSGGLRRAAAHAVELARRTHDPNLRAALLELALKWVSQEPSGIESQRRLEGALQEFNHQQLFERGNGPRRATG